MAPEGSVLGAPRLILRLESLMWLLLLLFIFSMGEGSWGLFALLFFVPDVGLLGYLVNARLGAIAYNCLHNQLLPIALAVVAIYFHIAWLFEVLIIWLTHIHFDRALGIGLKYERGFAYTHLGCLIRKKSVISR